MVSGINNWDEFQRVPIEEINFDSTSLIFMGDNVFFKEWFTIKNVDLSALKVIHYYGIP